MASARSRPCRSRRTPLSCWKCHTRETQTLAHLARSLSSSWRSETCAFTSILATLCLEIALQYKKYQSSQQSNAHRHQRDLAAIPTLQHGHHQATISELAQDGEDLSPSRTNHTAQSSPVAGAVPLQQRRSNTKKTTSNRELWQRHQLPGQEGEPCSQSVLAASTLAHRSNCIRSMRARQRRRLA